MGKNNDEVPDDLFQDRFTKNMSVNMNDVVGKKDILFICLDTLRYDVAYEAETKNQTPIINSFGKWTKCHATGNFTYPSHHAMFAGYMPINVDCKSMFEQERLFFPKGVGLGEKPPKNSYLFSEENIVKSFEKDGYHTICIGGVGFFNKRTKLGKVFPNMFLESHWNPSFGCAVKESCENQLNFAAKRLDKVANEKRVFMYINISAIHYPNYFYSDGAKEDNYGTHLEALKYVDSCLPIIFDAFKKRGETFVIMLSDHGSSYGEDNIQFHGLNSETINTVPYKHFML